MNLLLLLCLCCCTGCKFSDNKVHTDGGAVYINQWGLAAGKIAISDSYFVRNKVSTAPARHQHSSWTAAGQQQNSRAQQQNSSSCEAASCLLAQCALN
jgi:hypothetical protein